MLRNGVWAVAVLGVAMVGCGGGGGTEAREPNEVAVAYQGPIQSSDVARGEEVYTALCMSCHGGAAPGLEGIGWEPGAMRQQVREGRGRMPAIAEGRLAAEDLEAVLAYLTTIQAVNGEVPGAPSTAGDESAPSDEDAAAPDEDAAAE